MSKDGNDDGDDGYTVGYKNPPKEHQFKNGEPSRSKGRPKGSKNLKTILREEMDEKVTINTPGGQKKICVRRALIKRLIERAFKGDIRASIKLMEYDIKFNRNNMIDDPDPNAPKTGVLAIAPPLTPEEFEEYAKTVKLPPETRDYSNEIDKE